MTEKETRRDFDVLSDRRREAMALLDEGMSQSEVSRELSVARQTVSRWAKLKAAYPDDEPWRKRPLGRPRGLTDEQKGALVRLLAETYVRESGPRPPGSKHGGDPKPARWTLARVAGLIEAGFGIAYSMAHVKTILSGLIGDDQWLLSRPQFWVRVIEMSYPEYAGKVLVEGWDDDWELDGRILWKLRRRLRS